jgi:hypothetical protein
MILPSVGHLDVYQLPEEKEYELIMVLNKVWIFLFIMIQCWPITYGETRGSNRNDQCYR